MLDMLEVCRCGWRIFHHTYMKYSLLILADFCFNKIVVFILKKKKKKKKTFFAAIHEFHCTF